MYEKSYNVGIMQKKHFRDIIQGHLTDLFGEKSVRMEMLAGKSNKKFAEQINLLANFTEQIE